MDIISGCYVTGKLFLMFCAVHTGSLTARAAPFIRNMVYTGLSMATLQMLMQHFLTI